MSEVNSGENCRGLDDGKGVRRDDGGSLEFESSESLLESENRRWHFLSKRG